MTDAAALELRQAVASANLSLEEMRGAGMPNAKLEAKLEIITRTVAELVFAGNEGSAGAEVHVATNPLAESAEEDGKGLVPADPDGATLASILLGVNGPKDTRGGRLVWDFLYTLTDIGNICGVFLVLVPLVDPALLPLAYMWALMRAGGTVGNAWAIRGLRVSLAGSDGDDDEAAPETGVLRQLLRTRVSPEGADTIAAMAPAARKEIKQGQMPTLLFFCMLGFFVVTYTELDAVMVGTIFCWTYFGQIVTTITGTLGTAFVPKVACAIVEDVAFGLSVRIAALGKMTTDRRTEALDRILVELNSLDKDVNRVSQLSFRGLIFQTGFMLWFDLMLLLAALGPRPADPEHGWNVYGPDWVFLVAFSLFLLIILSESAKPPANVTAKCDLILKELNCLRMLGDTRLADADTLTRVEALERYADKIGLGYKIPAENGIIISHAFINRMLLNMFTALSILLPMLIVMLERVVSPLEQGIVVDGSGVG